MRLLKIKAKLRKREWDAFHDRVLGPLTVNESNLFGEALALDGEAWDRFIQYIGALIGQEDIDAWIVWATKLQTLITKGSLDDVPAPPDEPGGLWDNARLVAAEAEEHEMGCAGGYVVTLLSYARKTRERQWLST